VLVALGTRIRATSLEVPAKRPKLNKMENLWMVHKKRVSKENQRRKDGSHE
jgi:hypothetical protein